MRLISSNWISRTAPKGRSPEVRRETGLSENNRMILSVGSPEPKSEMTALTGLNCQGGRTEKTLRRPNWRRERDSSPRYGRRDFGPSSDYLHRNDWLSSLIGALLCRLGCGQGAQGITPCPVVCSAGLRWCGGWRRTNLRGFHEQTQIEAKGRGPLDFTIHQQI
jgi:hypothetical protein